MAVSSIIDLLADAFTDCSGGQLAISFAILLGAIFYHVSKPLPVPSDLPGPTRYPWIGYLGHCIKHWHEWPTETRSGLPLGSVLRRRP